MEKQELATIKSGFAILARQTDNKNADDFLGVTPTFETVRFKDGKFIITDDDGNPASIEEFSGVIIHQQPLNSFYKNGYKEGDKMPPDCVSFDRRQGQGEPGGACNNCSNMEWKSDPKGDGKACKERTVLHILREGELLPIKLNLAVMSKVNFDNFIIRQHGKGRGLRDYITRFKGNGKVIELSLDRVLDNEERELVAQYTEQFKGSIQKTTTEE